MSKLEEVINMLKSPSSVADDSRCKDYTMKLKSSIKSQTDFQPGLTEDKRIRTDDIFTNVTIQRGQKRLKKHRAERGISRKGIVDEDEMYKGKDEDNSSHAHSLLNKCSEIFMFPIDSDAKVSKDMPDTYPKSILVTGQAGIGKTLFSQKLVRDWASDTLFEYEEKTSHPDFQFVFLLTFRQLNLLEEEKLNLCEVLNRSSLLNEQSTMDDTVFEYLLQNPKKLLLIIDGYDEYLHDGKVRGDSELKYPNNPREKMPIPVMVAKLLKGKILKDCVAMITSRPGEKVHDLKTNFDVQVEVTGFSSPQVEEFVTKYFKGNENMKNTVLDHLRQHEGMLEFVHVPVICLLMCNFMEWHITHSESPVDLPTTRTDLYHEVTKVVIRKHHLQLKYAMKEEADQVVEKTLPKLAEFAAKLLENKRYIFDEDVLKSLQFSKKEMESLKTSGVLYCCPGTRKSPFAEVTHEYAFIHLTIQEYLAAYGFVHCRRIPKKPGEVVSQFMSGLLARTKNEKLMAKSLNSMIIEYDDDDREYPDYRSLLLAKCLYEYGDMNFAKRFVSENFEVFCKQGCFRFVEVNVSNYVHCLTFVLDAMALLHEECSRSLGRTAAQPYNVYSFSLNNSNKLTSTDLRQITRSLTNAPSTVIELMLYGCSLKDDDLVGVSSICELLKSENCKLTSLVLSGNRITEKGLSSICESIRSENCKLTLLSISNNRITDGDFLISDLLRSKDCKLTALYLGQNKITDKGVSSICESLSSENCKLTSLELSHNEITDQGVFTICKSLTSVNSRLTTLGLGYITITDRGVSSICESLTSENCNLASLQLRGNKISNKQLLSISKSLTSVNCKLTTLYLGDNNITDKGVRNICASLKSKNCKLTTLQLNSPNITNKVAHNIGASLISENCKLTYLDLGLSKITFKGICQSVLHENCKLRTLILSGFSASNDSEGDQGDLYKLLIRKKPDFKLLLGF